MRKAWADEGLLDSNDTDHDGSNENKNDVCRDDNGTNMYS